MNESILETVKKLLGIADEYTVFDTDLIVHINSAIMILRQIGVGPRTGFAITGECETWGDFLGDNEPCSNFESVKSYIFLKVRQLFDPATNGAVTESTNNLIKELEYRLYCESAWPTM